MSQKEAFEKAVEIAGTRTALAKVLGIRPWALFKWNLDKIPENRCEQIEQFTQGEVKASELRPDINWNYIRNKKA
ncbi:MAG: Cro/Cl family transcriptional regulator [Acinetobacter sp. 38-8]|nr:MAG: Cro/Cl family transcriptional regulator [Acinetobacter sp. 38-8]